MTADSPATRFPILVPDVGTEGEPIRVSAWLVDAGQSIIEGDRIVEILIPGMTFDISAMDSGELVEISKAVDSSVSPGDILGWIQAEAPNSGSV